MTTVADRVDQETDRAGFLRLVRAEWTKFRSVRSWLIGMVLAALVMIVLGVLTGIASRSSYSAGPGQPDIIGHPFIPIGPGGQAVTDDFYFVHQAVSGDGSMVVRLESLAGRSVSLNSGVTAAEVQPWAKAGVMIKAGTDQGSSYAAVMITGGHGARVQYDFTGDIAGPASTLTPTWLRLTRAGNTVTGEVSPDGSSWTTIAAIPVALGQDAQVGLFATSPMRQTVTQHLGGGGSVTAGGAAMLTATFDSVALQGNWQATGWSGSALGSGPEAETTAVHEGFEQVGGILSVTGSGDIAPVTGSAGSAPERNLVGGFGTLTITAVLAALFVTTEYRRGLIRTTLAASPRRGRVLAAKALVIGGITFVLSAIAAAIALPVSSRLLEANGNFVAPTTFATDLRLVIGTAAVLGVTAVLALAVGAILRRSAIAVVVVVVLAVLPYLLANAAVLPPGPSDWLLRVTPSAAFTVQQTPVVYPQVDDAYTPAFGYYPLSPIAGFAVLCAYAAVAMGIAVVLIRRRDA